MKYLLLVTSFFFLATYSIGQVAIGQWQEYLSFYQVHSIQKVNDKIYAATNAGLFSYDTEEYIIQKYTKLNSLSDIEITAIKAIPNSDILLIGYENGNIDVLNNDEVINIPDLKLKSINSEKRINNILVNNNKAYCSTDFGIVVVDYKNYEIFDTYIIGDEATYLKVYEVTSTSDYLYAATEKGILSAPINSNSLAFYDTWETISSDQSEYTSICTVDESIICAKKQGSSANIMKYVDGNWSNIETQSNFLKIINTNEHLGIISSNSIKIFNSNLVLQTIIDDYFNEEIIIKPSFSSILIDNDDIWIGDSSNGLVHRYNTNDIPLAPNGPSSNKVYKMVASENLLYMVAGINHYVQYQFHMAELSILRDGSWTGLNSQNNDSLKGAYNLNDIAIDPRNENHVYVSSARSGIYEISNDTIIKHYTEKNSSMQAIGSWRLVNGVVVDENGNLFANNMSDNYPIIIKPDITAGVSNDDFGWYKLNYISYGIDESNPWLWQTIKTSWGHFWSISFRNPEGLFVYDIGERIDTDEDDRYRYAGDLNNTEQQKLLLWDEDGKTLEFKPKCLVEDKNGYIWVGTREGMVVYYRPRDVFDIEKPIASRIKIPRNDGSGLADYLLEGEDINCIAVDGANRKWIGTANNGLYLISADGTETIHNFNTSNSPLFSDMITTITINPKTGEVFIGTDKGILSYRGTATEGQKQYNNVKAFPNPVKPNYNGIITVTGLIENSNVRITDINGNIVYQANSTGGQIIWNGKNMYNEKVASGVYLVFATNEDGSESMATKILIVK